MSPRRWLSWALARVGSDLGASADGGVKELPREGAGQRQLSLLVPFAREPWLEGLSFEFSLWSLGSDCRKAFGERYPHKDVLAQGQSFQPWPLLCESPSTEPR